MSRQNSIVVIGAGIVGISTAYYLLRRHGQRQITLLDSGLPMAFTSAQSGENYRNWWPHPAMVALTNHSIDLMEEIAAESGNRIAMTRRGYALATRSAAIDPLIAQLHDGLQGDAHRLLRYHENPQSVTYRNFASPDWTTMPDGVDILTNADLIQRHFPQYDPEVRAVLHIRRGGSISGQQLGSFMLEHLRDNGLRPQTGTVRSITTGNGFGLDIETPDGPRTIKADQIVNAAGPFAPDIAAMLDVTLPLKNTLQQKIAFEDRNRAIPRSMPFSIDLDPQHIDWTEDEAALLRSDAAHAWLAREMPGAIHCRPDGGDNGTWVKLGWAYNTISAPASRSPDLDPGFPEIVLRGAARLNPALKSYYGNLPRNMHHYGGWYTMTEENWPLIGPMGPEGSFMNCAMSGFGTMAACASGALCADWITGSTLPAYAREMSLARYRDTPLMDALFAANKGVL